MNGHWLNWIIVVLALQQAGWMAYDGTRALTLGDYVTPNSGQYAGQLGPWSKLVEAVGLKPRSTLMKSIFAVYGSAWVIIIIGYVFRVPYTWAAMVVAAAGALWYLPFGTLSSTVQLVLLLQLPVRATS